MWSENISFTEEYGFKSSPESCSDISFTTDNMGSASDEDFMTQLSSDLDIPLLLNPGEDEMAVLNSFLDRTPNEILSDIASSHDYIESDMDIKQFDFLNEILPGNAGHTTNKSENNGCVKSDALSVANEGLQKGSQSSNNKSITYFDYLNEIDISSTYDPVDIKSEENSEESCSSRNSLEPSTPPPVISVKKQCSPVFFPTNILPKKEVIKTVDCSNVQVVPQVNKCPKVPIKRVPIKPKTPYTVPVKNSNIVVIKNIKSEFPNVKPNENNVLTVDNSLSSNIVVLDSIPVNNLNAITPSEYPTISHLSKPMTISSFSINSNNNIVVDPKILKKQERRIKNRESASISRKKKKDYLNSLEEQVKNLTDENRQLLEENSKLKERLSFYEDSCRFSLNSISPKRTKPALVLCAFLFVVGLNLNLGRNPFLSKPNVMSSKNSDYPKLPDHVGRNLLWKPEENEEKLNRFSPLTMCPASINQTESARLLLELEKWIGKPESAQKSAPPNSTEVKPKPRRKKMRLDLSLAQVKKRIRYGPENEFRNEIQVFSPRADHLYSEFFEAINRQDDTFYVVSFSEQHMLLPALYHNKTRRPKMSLLMPSVFPNETSTQTYIPLMQIDCEVLDTKLVNVKYGSIPRPYRYYGNVTKESNKGKGRSDNITSSTTHNYKKAYKPYFLSKNVLKTDEFN